MKKYRSHKIVEAAPIVAAEFKEDGSGVVYTSSDGTPGDKTVWHVPPGFKRPNTEPRMDADGGDYLVRYDDGYLSWSPRDKFEAGYTEVPADHRDRVRAEREALAGNLDRLTTFIRNDPRADDLMREQADMMAAYLNVLDRRIAAF